MGEWLKKARGKLSAIKQRTTRIFREQRQDDAAPTNKQFKIYDGLSHARLVELWRHEVKCREYDLLLHGPLLHTANVYRRGGSRIYNDDNANAESCTAFAAENATNAPCLMDTVYHLVYEVEETAGGDGGNFVASLEYEINNSGTWFTLNTGSTDGVSIPTTGVTVTTADGTAISSNRLTQVTANPGNEGVYHTDGTPPNVNFSANEHNEYQCPIILDSGVLSAGDTVNFRLANATSLEFTASIQATVPAPNTVQASVRVQASTSETAGFLAALNTAYTPPPAAGQFPQSLGIRALLQNTGPGAEPADYYDVYRNINAAGWAALLNSGDEVIFDTGSGLTDGGATTQRIGSGTFNAGAQRETVSDLTTVAIPAGEETEMLAAVRWDAGIIYQGNFQVRFEFNGGVDLDGYTNVAQVNINAYRRQSHFQFYNDDNADPDLCSAFAAADTNITISSGDLDTPIHLRLGLRQWMCRLNVWTRQLQFRRNGGTWTTITDASSFVRRAAGLPAQGALCDTQRITSAEPETFWGFGPYVEAVGNVQQTSQGNQLQETQYCIQFRSADVANGDVFEFRIYDGTSSVPVDVLDHTPQATISTGQNVTVNQVTETDTAQAITPQPGAVSITVNQVTETDTAQAITPQTTISVPVNQVTETDTAQAITPQTTISVPVNQVTETDTAQAITPQTTISVPVNQVTETDTAQPVSVSQGTSVTVNQVVETDTAQAITPQTTISVPVNQVTETDTAQTVTPSQAQLIAVNQVTETDTAQAITPVPGNVGITVNQVTETDTAQAITPQTTISVPVNQVTETDTAQAITPQTTISVPVNQVTETDTAQPVSVSQGTSVTVNQVVETDTAQAITPQTTISVPVNQVTETDTAQAITPQTTISVPVSQVTETDTAQLITPLQGLTAPVNQATETDTAQAITPQPGAVGVTVNQVTETDTAQAITLQAVISAPVNQVTETDTAQAITPVPGNVGITVNQVVETDTAQTITPVPGNVGITVNQTTETDTAQPVTASQVDVVPVNQVTEVDTAQPISAIFGQTITIGQVAETDIAQPIGVTGGEQGDVFDFPITLTAWDQSVITTAWVNTVRPTVWAQNPLPTVSGVVTLLS